MYFLVMFMVMSQLNLPTWVWAVFWVHMAAKLMMLAADCYNKGYKAALK